MKHHPFRSAPPLRGHPQTVEGIAVAAKPTIRYHWWYVDSGGGWYVICETTAVRARRYAVEENGRGNTKDVRRATNDEVGSYCRQKGCTRFQLVEEWRTRS